MTKNDYDSRNALFESSEYLAAVLARCAFIEKHFYHSKAPKVQDEGQLRSAIVNTYKAILCYAAEVRIAQTRSKGGRTLDSIIAITNKPFTNLKSSIDNEEKYLQQWLQLRHYLHHQEDAERLLAKGEEIQRSLHSLMDDFVLSRLHCLDDAAFDAYRREDDPNNGGRCLERTRTKLLESVKEWGTSSEGPCIFWLEGMAGTGKSTISRTVAALFEVEGMLGASFFFKRGEGDRANASRLLTTIATQLARRVPRIIPGIRKAIDDDRGITQKSLDKQFNKLLLEPLLQLKQSDQQQPPWVIVIDALDECEQKKDIEALLPLFLQMKRVRSTQLRFFLTSRPELPYSMGLKEMENTDHQDLILHDAPIPEITSDIRLFLDWKFERIRRKRSLPAEWPRDDQIQALVELAVPLFIFAATICRFIEDWNFHPKKRLEIFLQDPATRSASEMERTYLPIINHLTNYNGAESHELMSEFYEIIGVVICLAAPLSVNGLSHLLKRTKGTISSRVESFHSVLSVPSDPAAPVRILHLSFRDFLINTKSAFRVDANKTHANIALCCIHAMDASLKHNICGLSSYGAQRTDVQKWVIDQHLSAGLQYACRYWVYHLEHSRAYICEANILSFLKRHLLHWLEAMSIMGILPEAVGMINRLQLNVKGSIGSEFSEFIYDAKRFILKIFQIANTAPLQLYCTGLVLLPMESMIKRIFEGERCSRICILPQVEESWNAEIQTLEGHSDWILSVAFSPDGQPVASGSADCTIRLWDATAGKERQTLEGHSGSVRSLAFSHATLTKPNPQVFLENDWVAYRGERLLWLPFEYRDFLCSATNNGTLALGYLDGRVFIVGFHTQMD